MGIFTPGGLNWIRVPGDYTQVRNTDKGELRLKSGSHGLLSLNLNFHGKQYIRLGQEQIDINTPGGLNWIRVPGDFTQVRNIQVN